MRRLRRAWRRPSRLRRLWIRFTAACRPWPLEDYPETTALWIIRRTWGDKWQIDEHDGKWTARRAAWPVIRAQTPQGLHEALLAAQDGNLPPAEGGRDETFWGQTEIDLKPVPWRPYVDVPRQRGAHRGGGR